MIGEILLTFAQIIVLFLGLLLLSVIIGFIAVISKGQDNLSRKTIITIGIACALAAPIGYFTLPNNIISAIMGISLVVLWFGIMGSSVINMFEHVWSCVDTLICFVVGLFITTIVAFLFFDTTFIEINDFSKNVFSPIFIALGLFLVWCIWIFEKMIGHLEKGKEISVNNDDTIIDSKRTSCVKERKRYVAVKCKNK